MKYKAVITAEIINSTKSIQRVTSIREEIERICNSMNPWISAFDFYQGDSFQILLDSPEMAARLALILRCAVIGATTETSTQKSQSNNKNIKWDTRMSIGIGTVEYYGETVCTSDGLAFRLSGRGLDNLKKKRFAIHTHWEDFNQTIAVSTSFVDSVVRSWSIAQAKLMQKYLSSDCTDKELAQQLGESQQNLSKKLKRIEAGNIDMYLEYFERKVKKLTSEDED